MKIRRLYFLLCNLFLTSLVLGQSIKKVSFGKVPDEDVKMLVYPADSIAEAVVLDDIGTVYFGSTNEWTYNLERHTRIKILSEAGLQRGNLSIPFYSKDRRENISRVKAQVIQPDGSVIKVDKENIVDVKQNENYTLMKIAFQEVKVGSILEYSYTFTSRFILYPDEWLFQTDIPVRHSQLQFGRPPELDYSIIMTGGEKITQIEEYFIADNLPALRNESFITKPEDYYTRVNFQLKAYKTKNGLMEPIMNNWNTIATELYNYDGFGNRFYGNLQTNDFWKIIESDVAAKTSDYDKAKFIYDYVVSNVSWDQNYRLYPEKKGDRVMEDKKGSSADINAVIVNLMRKADLEANPIISSPRSQGWFNPVFPILSHIKYVIGCVEIDGKRILFNGANTYAPFGILDEDDFNRNGILLKKFTGEVVDIPTQNSISSHKFELKWNDEWKIEGLVASRYAEVGMDDEIEDHHGGNQESKWKKRLDHLPELEVVNYEGGITEKGFESSLNIVFGEGEEEAPDLIYFPTTMFSQFSKNPFKSERRNFPVDFGVGYTETILIIMEIPEGYMLESFPENLNISTKEREIVFSAKYSQAGNKLSVVRKTSINNAYILPSEYISIKNIFSQIELKNNDLLVFKKVE